MGVLESRIRAPPEGGAHQRGPGEVVAVDLVAPLHVGALPQVVVGRSAPEDAPARIGAREVAVDRGRGVDAEVRQTRPAE